MANTNMKAAIIASVIAVIFAAFGAINASAATYVSPVAQLPAASVTKALNDIKQPTTPGCSPTTVPYGDWQVLGGDPAKKGGVYNARSLKLFVNSAQGQTYLNLALGGDPAKVAAALWAIRSDKFTKGSLNYCDFYEIMSFGLNGPTVDHNVSFMDPNYSSKAAPAWKLSIPLSTKLVSTKASGWKVVSGTTKKAKDGSTTYTEMQTVTKRFAISVASMTVPFKCANISVNYTTVYVDVAAVDKKVRSTKPVAKKTPPTKKNPPKTVNATCDTSKGGTQTFTVGDGSVVVLNCNNNTNTATGGDANACTNGSCNNNPGPATPPAPATCPAGTYGTPPNCTTPPPAVCPAGTTGTPPNCTTPPPVFSTNYACTLNATASASSLTVAVNATGTASNGVNPSSVSYNWGDGVTATATHTYTTYGEKTVIVTVTWTVGPVITGTAVCQQKITLMAPNQPPVASWINLPLHIYSGGVAQVCATVTDPEGDNLSVVISASLGHTSVTYQITGNVWCVDYVGPTNNSSTPGNSFPDTLTLTANDFKSHTPSPTPLTGSFPVVTLAGVGP